MPNGDPRGRFFYPTLTLMMNSYKKHKVDQDYMTWDAICVYTVCLYKRRSRRKFREGGGGPDNIWAATYDFQQCGILTSVDSDVPMQPHSNFRNSKWCSASSLTLVEYSSDKQRLWSDCAYAQADLRLWWSQYHIVENLMHWLIFYLVINVQKAVRTSLEEQLFLEGLGDPYQNVLGKLLPLVIIPPANFVCRGYTVFTLSVRPSVHPSVCPCVRP